MVSKKALFEQMREDTIRTWQPWKEKELTELRECISEGFSSNVIVKYKDKFSFSNRSPKALRSKIYVLQRELK